MNKRDIEKIRNVFLSYYTAQVSIRKMSDYLQKNWRKLGYKSPQELIAEINIPAVMYSRVKEWAMEWNSCIKLNLDPIKVSIDRSWRSVYYAEKNAKEIPSDILIELMKLGRNKMLKEIEKYKKQGKIKTSILISCMNPNVKKYLMTNHDRIIEYIDKKGRMKLQYYKVNRIKRYLKKKGFISGKDYIIKGRQAS